MSAATTVSISPRKSRRKSSLDARYTGTTSVDRYISSSTSKCEGIAASNLVAKSLQITIRIAPRRAQTPISLMRASTPLLVLSLVWGLHEVASTDVCAGPFKTLSLSCNGLCDTDSSCVVYSTAEATPCDYSDLSSASSCVKPTTSTSCIYQCFKPADTKVFAFYIPANDTTRVKKTDAARTDTTTPSSSLTSDIPYETNEFVRRIGVLNVSSTVTTLTISGGRDPDTGTRGAVVDVAIDPAAFKDAINVNRIEVMNTDLGKNFPDIASILPTQIGVLDLTNNNLSVVPPSLSKLSLIQAMSIEKNFLTEIPTSLQMPQLRALYLSANSLTSFSTNFPLLQILDLSSNLLTSFPTIIFSFPQLNTLKLDKNPTMAPVNFTASQYARLSRFEDFSIDASVLDTTSCPSSQLRTLPRSDDAKVCVVPDSESTSNSIVDATTAPTTTGGGGRPTMATVVIAVAVVVGFVGWC